MISIVEKWASVNGKMEKVKSFMIIITQKLWGSCIKALKKSLIEL